MIAALLTTFLFAISAICGHRSATQIGGVEANFWRAGFATLFLAIWANTLGSGFEGSAFPIFVLSGLAGIGIGDSGYFQALTRLGSRRTVLLTQCLTAPFAVAIEWAWLKTTLTGMQLVCIAVILVGVGTALAPDDHVKITPRNLWTGIAACVIAALGGALGAVLSRKAYAVAHAAGEHPDPGTTGYQRVIGGAIALGVLLLIVKWRTAHGHGGVGETMKVSRDKWRRIWPLVLANSLAGQTLGVTCMQWALENTPTGIVTAIISITPIIMFPLTRMIDGERIRPHTLAGGGIAVAGVIGLTLSH